MFDEAGGLLKPRTNLTVGKYSFMKYPEKAKPEPDVTIEISPGSGAVKYHDRKNGVTVDTPCPSFLDAWNFVGSLIAESAAHCDSFQINIARTKK